MVFKRVTQNRKRGRRSTTFRKGNVFSQNCGCAELQHRMNLSSVGNTLKYAVEDTQMCGTPEPKAKLWVPVQAVEFTQKT